MTRIGLIGGEPYERDLLREWLAAVPGVESIAALVGDGLGARPAPEQELDVIVGVIDDDSDDPGGWCQRLLRYGPARRLVAVLRNPTDLVIRQLARAGASSMVAVASGPRILVNAVAVVATGGNWLDPALSTEILRTLGHRPADEIPHGLTVKEWEVAQCFPRGLSNREIALELNVSQETVKTHVRSIFAKLKVRNRIEAARIISQDIDG